MSLLKPTRPVICAVFLFLSTASGFWGASRALKGQFPYNAYIATLDADFNRHESNGVLLSDQWVITANRHIGLGGGRLFMIVLGVLDHSDKSEDGRIVNVTRDIFVATNDTSINRAMWNEVALLKMTRKVNFTDNIQPVHLSVAQEISGGFAVVGNANYFQFRMCRNYETQPNS